MWVNNHMLMTCKLRYVKRAFHGFLIVYFILWLDNYIRVVGG